MGLANFAKQHYKNNKNINNNNKKEIASPTLDNLDFKELKNTWMKWSSKLDGPFAL